jgi:hypothetical protein
MHRHRGLISWVVGLLTVGVVGSPAAHATLVTTAQVSLTYEDSSSYQTFDDTGGGAGATQASMQGSLPLTSGFAEAQLPPGTGVPAVVLRASATGDQSGENGASGGGYAVARVTTDEIVFTTPANSLGSQFTLGLDFNLDGTLLASGGTSYADLAVAFFSANDEGFNPTHFLFLSNVLGPGPIHLSQTGFTSYGGLLSLPGAQQATDYAMILDISLTVGANGSGTSGATPTYGSSSADFANTFTASLTYDPALTLTSPFNAVPEPGSLVEVLVGFVMLAALRRSKLPAT